MQCHLHLQQGSEPGNRVRREALGGDQSDQIRSALHRRPGKSCRAGVVVCNVWCVYICWVVSGCGWCAWCGWYAVPPNQCAAWGRELSAPTNYTAVSCVWRGCLQLMGCGATGDVEVGKFWASLVRRRPFFFGIETAPRARAESKHRSEKNILRATWLTATRLIRDRGASPVTTTQLQLLLGTFVPEEAGVCDDGGSTHGSLQGEQTPTYPSIPSVSLPSPHFLSFLPLISTLRLAPPLLNKS